MRITKLTLMIDNSTHYLPYPFTYQPDPIITNIEPAESFVSGGRLILITGQHLASPQSTKLMVYHEHKPSIINGTSCRPQNDTLITCLTPALSREMLASLYTSPFDTSIEQQLQLHQPNQGSSLSYESGGLKLKMSLFMDDVRSVRHLDEYYHHLPHYLTYYDDPQLFRLQTQVVDYTNELHIGGENLKMKQLDQDLLITIGSHICTIKLLTANQVVCEPPEKISPIYDDSSKRPLDNPILPIIALVGANLKYHIGHMQYSSSQYQVDLPTQPLINNLNMNDKSARIEPSTSVTNSTSLAILICLSIVGFIIGFAATFMFALSKFRHSKAEREYKRIQLQMGSLDVNGQPFNGNLFDNIKIGKSPSLSAAHNHHQSAGVRSRALDYVGGAFSSKKLFNQLNQQLPSFPPSPLTDISSLTGSNPSAALHNQHVVRLSSNGTIINSTATNSNHLNQQNYNNNINSANSNSSQSSPSSTRNYGNVSNNNNHLFNGQNQNSFSQQIHQQQIHQQQSSNLSADKSHLLGHHHQNHQQQHHQSPVLSGNSRNYSWTQEAPSTIVPYAVIEACNLTLEGKNAIKEYV